MRDPRLPRRALAALLLWLAAACATPGLPEAPATSSVTTTAMRRTQELYLYPERLDRRVMVGALDALEARFDSVRFDYVAGEDEGILMVGSDSGRVPLDAEIDPVRFEAVLGRALTFVGTRLGDEANRDENSDLELIALRGALGALDRYSTIFAGRSTQDFQIRFSGKLRGIGARIGRRDGNLIAVRVFPASPAEAGGLQDGDAILYIDGNPTRPLTLADAVGQLRGKAGTVVRLDVLRGDERLPIEITRGEVTVPSVETRSLGDGIGYARITTVSRTTVEEFKTKALELGALSGLVLDLRGNTGGSMVAAASLANLFLDSGMIVRVVNRNGDPLRAGRNRALATPGVLFGVRVAVLVDPSTASAAEILSGALAPLPRTTLIGQTTFGKGLIQRVMPLPEKTLLKLTVGEYLLSGERAIHERGVEPDIVLFPVSPENLGALANVPSGALAYVRRPGEDDTFPIDFAREVLLSTPDEALRAGRERSNGEIQAELLPYGITWTQPEGLPRGPFPEPLAIAMGSEALVGGQPASLRIRVENPNDFAIPDAWAALEGPADYLSNRVVALGHVPAQGAAEGQIELVPSEGLSVNPLGLQVRVAAGTRALQSERLVLPLAVHAPRIEIQVARLEDDRVSVTLENQGCCDAGAIRVVVPGAVRSLEALPPGARETVELPVAGEAEVVGVLLRGAGAQRRIEVPLPEDRVSVIPPDLELERASWLGREQVRVRAQAAEGLHEGWVALNGQKELWVAWDGSSDGTLRADLEEGDHRVTTKIETVSGVAVIDSRQLIAD